MSAQEKYQQIRQYKKEHPDATYDEMRSRFECSFSTVSRALRNDVMEEGAFVPTPVVQFAVTCPKTYTFVQAQLKWAVRNKRKYMVEVLKECVGEMLSVV